MFRRRFADFLLFSVTATELVILFLLTPTFTITDWVYVLQHFIVLGIALMRPHAKVRDYSVTASVAVGVAYVYPYAQVIYLRWSPGHVAWPTAGLALVTLAAGLSLVSLLTMGRFYQLQGFTAEESQKMAERLAEQPERFVQAMAQSELGLSEHRFPNQWTAATSAAISTAIGAFVPIIPFFFSGGMTAVIISFGISLVAHFLVGALKSLITIRSWWASGLEMTWIGIIVAVVTYGLGLAFGSLG
jgi:predicted membrane protein (TIGR00267 family)